MDLLDRLPHWLGHLDQAFVSQMTDTALPYAVGARTRRGHACWAELRPTRLGATLAGGPYSMWGCVVRAPEFRQTTGRM